MPNLTIYEHGKERLFQIEGQLCSIGRSATNSVELDEATASKEHCRILQQADRWKLVDLESKNGTRVNGTYRNKAWLDHGDVIQVGHAKLRFGREGAQRTVAPQRVAAETATRRRDDGQSDEAPPPRRYRRDPTDQYVKWGAWLLGAVIIVIVVNWIGNKTARGAYNLAVLAEAKKLLEEDRWEDAIRYLDEEGDPSQNGYTRIAERLLILRGGLAAHRKDQRNRAALKIVSTLGRKVQAYHKGKRKTTSPEQILQLVERLKTEYADTEQTAQARSKWPAWFAGRVPQRATDLIRSGGKLKRDWEETLQRAEEYRKEWRYREARETIEKFLTVREAILEESDREYYKRERDHEISNIDRLAQSTYYGQRKRADQLIKNNRFGEAIALYRKVVERFGLDLYVRRAQTEILKIEESKSRKGK